MHLQGGQGHSVALYPVVLSDFVLALCPLSSFSSSASLLYFVCLYSAYRRRDLMETREGGTLRVFRSNSVT